MTAYSSFIHDFPKRCQDLLLKYEEDAQENDREVTLLFAIATSAFTIPFERIRPSANDHIADDRHRNAVRKLGKLENQDFTQWQKGRNWMLIEGIDGQQIRTTQVDAWAAPGKRQPITGKKTGFILSLLRNALSHGNIFLYPRQDPQRKPIQIKSIVFLSKQRDKETDQLIDKYNAVIASPQDFRRLILDWITFLEESNWAGTPA